MEGAMDHPRRKSDLDFDYDSYGVERRLDSEQAPDAAGYWFLAAVLFAFIAAGIIVYRAGNAEMQTAANYLAIQRRRQASLIRSRFYRSIKASEARITRQSRPRI
jgi:hypothetical protein